MIVIWLWLVVITCPRTDSSFTKYVRNVLCFGHTNRYVLAFIELLRATLDWLSYIKNKLITPANQNTRINSNEAIRTWSKCVQRETPVTLPAQNTLGNVLCFGHKNWCILALVELLPSILTVVHQEQNNYTCQLEYKQKFMLTNQNLKRMWAPAKNAGKRLSVNKLPM